MTGWEGVKAAAESGAAVALVEGGDVKLSGRVVRDAPGVYRLRPATGVDVVLLRVGGGRAPG